MIHLLFSKTKRLKSSEKHANWYKEKTRTENGHAKSMYVVPFGLVERSNVMWMCGCIDFFTLLSKSRSGKE